MIASRLNVYVDTYRLVGKLLMAQMQFSRQFKYSLGTKMQDKAIELFEYIQLANMFKDNREKYLNGFIVKFESVRTLLRLACDMKQIPIKRQAEIFALIENISRQITAWKNSPHKKTKTSGETKPNMCVGS